MQDLCMRNTHCVSIYLLLCMCMYVIHTMYLWVYVFMVYTYVCTGWILNPIILQSPPCMRASARGGSHVVIFAILPLLPSLRLSSRPSPSLSLPFAWVVALVLVPDWHCQCLATSVCARLSRRQPFAWESFVLMAIYDLLYGEVLNRWPWRCLFVQLSCGQSWSTLSTKATLQKLPGQELQGKLFGGWWQLDRALTGREERNGRWLNKMVVHLFKRIFCMTCVFL